VPLIPSTLTLRTYEQLADFVGAEVDRRPDIVAFFSMVDQRKRLHREVVETLPDGRDDIVATAIPAATEVELMGVERSPVVMHAPRSRAARAYADLWAELRARLGV
jgi:cellulose biosynthesis protein BcsQ